MASDGAPASPSRPHVALVPFPFSSHTASLFALARAIAAAKPAAVLSFISTEQSLASLPSAEVHRVANLRLLPVADGIPKLPETPAMSELEKIGPFLSTMPAGLRSALDEAAAAAGGAKVSCVVSDAFMWMAAEVAETMGVPWVALYTCAPASLFSHFYTDLLRDTVGVDEQAIARREELLRFAPALAAHRVGDLPEGVVAGGIESPFSRNLHCMGQSLPRGAAILLNTFHGLDPVMDAELRANFSCPLLIGPLHLLAPPLAPAADPNGCLPWLDRRDASSVVYVGFGTIAMPVPAELSELARGLEASGVAFLWSLKHKAWPLLPRGFLERTREHGLVVDWAPQLDVLRHAAVGATLTHCGWNSVTEGLAAGVPMVCRPSFADQMLNARTMSATWKVGVGFEGEVMTEEGVKKALELVLRSDMGRMMREKAGKLKAMAARAVEPPEGSSRVDFKKFLEFL